MVLLISGVILNIGCNSFLNEINTKDVNGYNEETIFNTFITVFKISQI
jgi:hypothetical protein